MNGLRKQWRGTYLFYLDRNGRYASQSLQKRGRRVIEEEDTGGLK